MIRYIKVWLLVARPYSCVCCGCVCEPGDDLHFKAEDESNFAVCSSCADVIMNVQHHRCSGEYVTWENERKARGYTKKPIAKERRWEVWERDNFTCKHCGTRKNLAVDHIRPEVHGGSDELENLQTLCHPCNSRKGKKLPEARHG